MLTELDNFVSFLFFLQKFSLRLAVVWIPALADCLRRAVLCPRVLYWVFSS